MSMLFVMIGTWWCEENKSFSFSFSSGTSKTCWMSTPWGRHIRDISHFWFPPVNKTRRTLWTCPNSLLGYAQLLSMERPLLSHILMLSWDLARGHTWKHELRNMQGYWPSEHELARSTQSTALAPYNSVRWLLYYVLLFRQVLRCSTSSCCKVQSGLSISTS